MTVIVVACPVSPSKGLNPTFFSLLIKNISITGLGFLKKCTIHWPAPQRETKMNFGIHTDGRLY